MILYTGMSICTSVVHQTSAEVVKFLPWTWGNTLATTSQNVEQWKKQTRLKKSTMLLLSYKYLKMKPVLPVITMNLKHLCLILSQMREAALKASTRFPYSLLSHMRNKPILQYSVLPALKQKCQWFLSIMNYQMIILHNWTQWKLQYNYCSCNVYIEWCVHWMNKKKFKCVKVARLSCVTSKK